MYVDIATLKIIAGHDDVHRLDREFDHLCGLGLIHHGFRDQVADITPTPLALHLCVRCQGFLGSPVEFFKLTHDASLKPPGYLKEPMIRGPKKAGDLLPGLTHFA